MLCRPAIAISNPRFALFCSRMSSKIGPSSSPSTARDFSFLTYGAMSFFPLKCSTSSLSVLTPKSVMPETRDASSKFSSGRKNSLIFLSRAVIAIESAPRIPRTSPSSASSPANNFPAGLNFTCSDARRNESAIGKSKAPPSFFKVAGGGGTTIFLLLFFGDSKSLFFIADAILSFASSTDLSGRPTIENACRPFAISVSTETTCARGSAGCAPKILAKPEAIFCFFPPFEATIIFVHGSACPHRSLPLASNGARPSEQLTACSHHFVAHKVDKPAAPPYLLLTTYYQL